MTPKTSIAAALRDGDAGIIVERLDGVLVDVNATASRLLGYEREALVGRPYTNLCVPDERATQSMVRAALVAGKRGSHVGRWHYVKQDGSTLVGDVITTRTLDGSGVPHGIAWVLHERVPLAPDDPVPDAPVVGERLESLGRLAGGIAHDFNNVLAVIRGNLEFARDFLDQAEPDVRAALVDLRALDRATERATMLVRQLLAFGRMQTRTPEALDVNAVVRDISPLLRLSIGAEVHLALRLAPELPRVLADRTQMEQVLMNLVVNARDAISERMASGAESWRGITIATGIKSVDVATAGRIGVGEAGDYVCISVRDTGIGMSEATRARIFEPFFTTKPIDRGTGLGLAAAWGMVKQSGGSIQVDTRYGEGSTFTVYLPSLALRERESAVAARPVDEATPMRDRVPPSTRVPEPPRGTRTVLLAEDDHAVRRVAARHLRTAGYRVFEAGDGVDALELLRAHPGEIDVVLADVRMPRLRGDALARLIGNEWPGLPVVLMTGYGDSPAPLESDGLVDGQTPLGKPFTGVELLDRLASVLPAVAEDVR